MFSTNTKTNTNTMRIDKVEHATRTTDVALNTTHRINTHRDNEHKSFSSKAHSIPLTAQSHFKRKGYRYTVHDDFACSSMQYEACSMQFRAQSFAELFVSIHAFPTSNANNHPRQHTAFIAAHQRINEHDSEEFQCPTKSMTSQHTPAPTA